MPVVHKLHNHTITLHNFFLGQVENKIPYVATHCGTALGVTREYKELESSESGKVLKH